MAQIIVVGGGFGGIVAAQSLRNAVGPAHDITLMAPTERFDLRAAFPAVALGRLKPESIGLSLPALCQKAGIQFIPAQVEYIDPVERTIRSSETSWAYDYLVLAMGAHFAYEKISGFGAHGYSLETLDMALHLRQAIEAFRGGAFVAGVAPDSPCEGPALEMVFQFERSLRRRGLRDQSTIHYVTAKSVPFLAGGPVVQTFVADQLRDAGIYLHVNRHITEVAASHVGFAEGSPIPSQLTVLMPAYQGPSALVGSGLSADGGFMVVDDHLRSPRYPNIYATGDMVQMAGPKMAHNAMRGAKIIAENVAQALRTESVSHSFVPQVLCIMDMGDREAAYIEADTIFGGNRSQVPLQGPVAAFMKEAFRDYFLQREGNIEYIL